jgi:hypothetical protein
MINTTTRKRWTKAKQRSLATWIFGTLLFFFLIGVFVFAPESLPEFKHRLLALLSALLAAFFGYFLTGEINIEIARNSKIGQLIIKAAGGLALFVLVLWWWTSPLAPTMEKKNNTPIKPYEQVLSGSVRTELGQPLKGVSVSLPEFNVTDKTDNLGRFDIKVKADHQKSVEMIAQKKGYKPHEQYATLGNTSMSFTMNEAK